MPGHPEGRNIKPSTGCRTACSRPKIRSLCLNLNPFKFHWLSGKSINSSFDVRELQSMQLSQTDEKINPEIENFTSFTNSYSIE